MFNRKTSLQLEEAFFLIITGNGTKEDFEFILSPQKIFITNHQNYIKKLNYALSHQDKIIKINTKHIEKDLIYIKTLFHEQNQRKRHRTPQQYVCKSCVPVEKQSCNHER